MTDVCASPIPSTAPKDDCHPSIALVQICRTSCKYLHTRKAASVKLMESDRTNAGQQPPVVRTEPPFVAPALRTPTANSRESAQTFYRRRGQHKPAAPAASLASATKAMKEVVITISDNDEVATSTKNKAHARVVAKKNMVNNKPHSRTKHSMNTENASSTSLHRKTAGEQEPYCRPLKGGRRSSSTKDASQYREAHSHHDENTHDARLSRRQKKHLRMQHHQDWQGQNYANVEQLQSGLACNRQWENIETAGGKCSRVPSFSIMTYNLLANSLANNNRHLYHGYLDVALNWKKRCATLLAELQCMAPLSKLLMYCAESQTVHRETKISSLPSDTVATNLDIFCLQELDGQDYRYAFEPMFRNRGYHGAFKKRTGSKVDGCALFYNKSRIRAQCIEFVEYRANAFASTSENVGIVAILDVIGKGPIPTKTICVATTHILFNHRRGMIKLTQLKMLLDRAEQLMRRQPCVIPIVLCGDLNIAPDSLLMRFLMSKFVDVSKMPEHFMSGTDGVYNGPVKYFENDVGRFHHAFGTTAGPGAGMIGLPAKAIPHGHGNVDVSNHPSNTELNPLDPIVSQPFNFENAYSGRKSFGHHGELHYQNAESYNRQWTTFHARARLTCDYILYGHLRGSTPSQGNSEHSGHGLEVSARLKLPCTELSETHGMPTWDFGSDHLSLAAWFNIL
ncbi:Protein angel 2 [Mortierella alpina]|uniref:Protein angel 2 n=1 Tax=Mortierella alpina TaxID=64518 RepID=A0A9P6IYJ6_MORAP|nr:Protein angel 2 [Mortierella alpina]